jgi:hypothetical protein
MNLSEGLEYKDMENIIKPEIHIDEFVSKMGNDDNIVVISFYVKSSDATDDLISWFERGYKFVLDSDRSQGEISPSRYLVFVEIKRRTALTDQIDELLSDLTTLTEHSLDDWRVTVDGMTFPYSKNAIKKYVVLSPHTYRMRNEIALNEIREAAGLKTKPTYHADEDILTIQRQARII